MHGYVENSRIDFYSLFELPFRIEIIFSLSSNICIVVSFSLNYVILVIRKLIKSCN